MRQRNGILILLVISFLISVSGCTFTQIADGPERSPDPMAGIVTPEPRIMANPVPLLCGVETDRRIVSLVFEGYTDDSTMTAIAEVLEEKEIPAVFFLSGITANEHPSTLQKLAGRFEIGNYGMGGGKHLENYPAFENAEKFKLAQDLRMRKNSNWRRSRFHRPQEKGRPFCDATIRNIQRMFCARPRQQGCRRPLSRRHI